MTSALKRSREELSHVQGQGQKPGGPHARRVVAKRSYPTSEVRGSSQECQAARVQDWPRRATQVRDQRQQPRGATPRPRPGAAAGRSNSTSKEQWLRGRRRAERSYPTLKVRKGSGEEIPLFQGKEQWLHFAGAAVKRYHSPR